MNKKTIFEQLNEDILFPKISIDVDKYLISTNWEFTDIINYHPIPRMYTKYFMNGDNKLILSITIQRDFCLVPVVGCSSSHIRKYNDEHIIAMCTYTEGYSEIREVKILPKEVNEFCKLMDGILKQTKIFCK